MISSLINAASSLTLMKNSENSQVQHQHLVDALGLKCPLPLLKMKQALNQAEIGETILVKATDPGSKRDFRAYIQTTRHHLIETEEEGRYYYWITKNA